jgi:hypothetical protein
MANDTSLAQAGMLHQSRILLRSSNAWSVVPLEEKRERDWRFAGGIPISIWRPMQWASVQTNGDNHEDVERTAGARAGRWSRGYELSAG